MQNHSSFEWRGVEPFFSPVDVGSVLEFEFRPEVVDFARPLLLRPVTRATVVGAKAAWLKGPRAKHRNLNN